LREVFSSVTEFAARQVLGIEQLQFIFGGRLEAAYIELKTTTHNVAPAVASFETRLSL